MCNSLRDLRSLVFHRPNGLGGLRRSLMAMAVCGCLATPVLAQDATATTDTDGKQDGSKKTTELDAVNVRGVRASLIKSQVIKRDSEQIVDSVSAEDIGALPDRSVTETLQRVSGVTIDHFMARNDPDHFSAEGSGVMIRGLTQVRGELNGRDIFSANSGRGLSFEDVPAELMAGVDVYKNPSAEIIEGGLGGTVNLRTRMPFDSPGRVIGGNADVNYGDFSKKYKPSGSFLYSDRWNTGLGEMGFLVDVAYSALNTRTDGIQVDPYTRRSDSGVLAGTDFDQVYVPGGMAWRSLDFERKRKGVSAAFQWRPDEDTELYAQYLRSSYEMQWLEHAVWFGSSSDTITPADGTTFNYDDDGVFVSGTPVSDTSGNPLRVNTDTRLAWQKTTTSDLSLGFKRQLTDRIKLSADAQLVQSDSNALDFTVFASTYLSGVSWDVSGKYPSASVSDSSATNATDYFWYAAMDHHAQNRGRELALRADLEYTFLDSDWLRYAKFGLRSTDRTQTNKSSGYNWGAISDSWATIDSDSGLADMASYLSSYASLYTMSNFYKGKVSVPTTLYFPAASLVSNYGQAVSLIQALYASRGWGWSPDSYDVADINRQFERTQAAYAIVYFGNDEAMGAGVDGNVGVRIVQTKTRASGYGQYPDLTDSVASSTLQSQYYGQYFPIEAEGSYTNVLPSFNLRVKLTDNLQWRFALSKAMARPDYSQLQPYLTLSATVDDDGNITKWSGTAGNPNLKPMTADQADMALEWYFDNSDMLYGTLFYKKVKDYFATQTKTETYDGQDYLVTRPYNMDKGIIKGLEVGYTQFFDSLPGWMSGFGINANFTYVDSQGGTNTATDPYTDTSVTGVSLPLEGLSRRSYNLAGIYEKGPISARLAYNWRSRYLLTTSDSATDLPTWADDYGQLDGSVFYRFNPHWQLGMQVNNLTNAETHVLMGPTVYADGQVDYRLYTRGWFVTDRRYSLVLRANW